MHSVRRAHLGWARITVFTVLILNRNISLTQRTKSKEERNRSQLPVFTKIHTIKAFKAMDTKIGNTRFPIHFENTN